MGERPSEVSGNDMFAMFAVTGHRVSRLTEVGEFVGVSGPGLLSHLTETRQVT